MTQHHSRSLQIGKRGFYFLLVVVLLAVLTLTSVGRVKTASAQTPPPYLVATGDGFTPGESVEFTTTDPNGETLTSGTMNAAADGSVVVRIQTTDPDGLTTGQPGNYFTIVNVVDDGGNVIGQYLLVILLRPSVGDWKLNATGTVSGTAKVLNFTVS